MLHKMSGAAQDIGNDVQTKWSQLKSKLHQAVDGKIGKSEQKRTYGSI